MTDEVKTTPRRFVGAKDLPVDIVGIHVQSGYVPIGEIGEFTDDEITMFGGQYELEEVDARTKEVKAAVDADPPPPGTAAGGTSVTPELQGSPTTTPARSGDREVKS